jgi:hypothetical protein
MAAEDHNGGRSPSVYPTRVDHSVDALARGLADGTVSRRKALRLMGGVLLGGTLASIPGIAWAKSDKCKKDSQCSVGAKCCSGICLDTTNSDLNCGCCNCNCQELGSSIHCCNTICEDFNKDGNCGDCGRTCDPAPPRCETCLGGTTRGSCSRKQCPGRKVLDPSGQTCNCVCPEGTTACGEECCNSENCEECDPTTGTCRACERLGPDFNCCGPPGFRNCYHVTDQRHCGTCDNNCFDKCNSGSARCCDGICVVTATTCDDARVC